MFEKFKAYIPYAVAILAVVVIGYIGHRPKAVKTQPPVIVEQPTEPAVEPFPAEEVEEEPAQPEAPVVVPQKKPKKKPEAKPNTVKKPKKQPKPKRQVVEHTPRVPVPGPRRVCDETGWCWTYLW